MLGAGASGAPAHVWASDGNAPATIKVSRTNESVATAGADETVKVGDDVKLFGPRSISTYFLLL